MVVVAVVVMHGVETLGEFVWHTRAFLFVQVLQKASERVGIVADDWLIAHAQRQ
jgi:hypothetical protein